MIFIVLVYWWAIAVAAWIVILALGMIWVRICDRIDRDIARTYGALDEDEQEARRDALMLSLLIAEMHPPEDTADRLYLPPEWVR